MAFGYDLIRAVTLIAGYGYTAQQDKKTCIWGQSVLSGFIFVGVFLFPSTVLNQSNGADMLTYLVRVFASLMIGGNAMWYLSRNSRDDYVAGALLWCRLMGVLLLLSISAYSYTQFGDKFDDNMLGFVVMCVCLLLSTAYQFWRGQYNVGGREQKGHISTVLRLNFLILFFTGLLNMTYPSWVIPFKKLGQMETMMMRCIGANFFAISFTAWYATSFRYDEDRNAFFLSEIVTCVLMFVNLNIAYFHHGLFNPREALAMHLGSVPALVVLLGLYLIWKKNQPTSQTTYYTRSKVQ